MPRARFPWAVFLAIVTGLLVLGWKTLPGWFRF